MNTKDYFFCYNKRLARYLIDHKHQFITRAINPSTNNPFWLFKTSPALTTTIKEYKASVNIGEN